jgi:hypothetical protein
VITYNATLFQYVCGEIFLSFHIFYQYMILIYLLIAIGFTPGGSSTVHICTQTIHRTTQLIWEKCRPCPIFASYTPAFALQLTKKQGKTSVRVAKECQLAHENRIYRTDATRCTNI